MEHATTLNLPTVAARNNARDGLAEAMAAFLGSGGEIDHLDGFEGAKPLPARREIPRSNKPLKRARTRPKSHRMTAEEEQDLVAKIRAHAAAAMTQKAAREALGIGQMLFVCLCFEYGIKFPKNIQDHRQVANEKISLKARAKRDEMAPKVAERAHLSARACGKALGVSEGNIRRIARENGIVMKGGQ